MIYTSAIYATADESMVTGTDAEGATETIPADYRIFRVKTALEVFLEGGGVIEPYVEPIPPPFVPHLNYGGLARFSGASPVVVSEAIRMIGVTRVSKGRYRAYHTDPMATDQYSAMASVFDAQPRSIRVTARTDRFVEVRVTDLLGVAQDPFEAVVKTERVVTE